MTHATITAHTPTVCVVEFAFNEQAKNTVKALPGTSYDGSTWFVPIMHLPTLKGVFDKLTVEPAVVDAYYALLRRMVADFKGHECKKGVKALLEKHAVGIAAMQAKGMQMELTRSNTHG